VLSDLARGRRVTRVTLERAYRRVRPISFDHAVLERTRGVLAIRGSFRWSDLGSWDAIGEHLPARSGNRIGGRGPVVAIDARDNVIWNPTGRVLALIGLEGYVIVNTEDAVLVCAKERAQDVRQIVEELEGRRRGDLT
jgi:mannose-1-phosphate guanylyltransferase